MSERRAGRSRDNEASDDTDLDADADAYLDAHWLANPVVAVDADGDLYAKLHAPVPESLAPRPADSIGSADEELVAANQLRIEVLRRRRYSADVPAIDLDDLVHDREVIPAMIVVAVSVAGGVVLAAFVGAAAWPIMFALGPVIALVWDADRRRLKRRRQSVDKPSSDNRD
jgi:hypothetical protein